MPEEQTKAELVLIKLGERLRAGMAAKRSLTEAEREAVRKGVREQWEREEKVRQLRKSADESDRRWQEEQQRKAQEQSQQPTETHEDQDHEQGEDPGQQQRHSF